MKKLLFMFILSSLCLVGCEKDDDMPTQDERKGIVFKLNPAHFEGEEPQADARDAGMYNRLDYYFMDESGRPVANVKATYNEPTRELTAEGLRRGKYTLLVLAVRGDAEKDGAVIARLTHKDEVWLKFPEAMSKPLESEYLYACMPFEVEVQDRPDGQQEVVSAAQEVTLNRIVGRMDVACKFNNPYVEHASSGSRLKLDNAVFYTSFRANGTYEGRTTGELSEINLDKNWSFFFLPSVTDELQEDHGGEVVIKTRTYKGTTVQRSFSFRQIPVKANRITKVNLQIAHPEDSRGTLFATWSAYEASTHALILQDDEPVSVYTDASQRSFSAMQPLQLRITDDNRFHARFYCPRPLKKVTVQAQIPSVTKEKLDFAYFDSIPGFGEVYLPVPLLNKPALFYTETGKQIRIPSLTPALLKEATFSISSDDECWKRLSQIKYNYGIKKFHLFGGDPTKDNGGPAGNWKGIRPVHCREAVAVWLNIAYMLSLDSEMDQLIKSHDGQYKDDGGNNVSADRLLSQLRQGYMLTVGLINLAYSGTAGLADATGNYGVIQQYWVRHYDWLQAVEAIFHELGHVMGYGHSSTLTYGKWAAEVMNTFYVNNLTRFPIDSPSYLNTKQNPNLYKAD